MLVFLSPVQTERAADHQKWQRSVAHVSASPGRHGKRSILSDKKKKAENRSGRSERGMSDGRGAVLDLPNSSLDTAKSWLQEELEWIFSQ